MIRRLLTLIRKDVAIFFGDTVAVALSFVVPMVMIVIFGLAFGHPDRGLSELEVLVVNQDEGPAGGRLLRSLDELDEIHIIEKLRGDTTALDSARARRRVAQGRNSVALVVPRDFSAGLREGQVRLSILKDPRDPVVAGVVEGLLKQQVFTVFPGLMPAAMMKSAWGLDSLQALGFDRDVRRAVEKNFGVDIPDTLPFSQTMPEEMLLGRDPDSAATVDTSRFDFGGAIERVFRVRSEAVVGQNIANPGIAQSVAGTAVLFMLFAVGAIAASLLAEMQGGMVSRLLVSGVRPHELLVSKYFYAVALGCAQLVFMMIYGWIIFGLDVFAVPGKVAVMILCTAVAMSGVGLFVAALSRTAEQATGFQIVVNLGMSAVGGAMFPSFLMPSAVRAFAQVTPVHWAMQGFLDVFWRRQPLSGILPECGVLLGMALVLVTISVLVFRRRLAVELG